MCPGVSLVFQLEQFGLAFGKTTFVFNKSCILVLTGLYACTFLGINYQSYVRQKRDTSVRENEETRIALTPFILAEQQRLYLKQIRRNREFEQSLMADVPGWKVGHWYDYPVFHNPRGLWCDPILDEFYAHTTRRFASDRINVAHQYT